MVRSDRLFLVLGKDQGQEGIVVGHGDQLVTIHVHGGISFEGSPVRFEDLFSIPIVDLEQDQNNF